MDIKQRARQLKRDIPAVFLALTIRFIPQEVFEECRRESEHMWAGGKTKRWYYALPIVLIWVLVIGLIVKAIWF